MGRQSVNRRRRSGCVDLGQVGGASAPARLLVFFATAAKGDFSSECSRTAEAVLHRCPVLSHTSV